MKTSNKRNEKVYGVKNKTIAKPKKDQKVLLVAQEIKFARLLSGNDKKKRDRVLKSLKKWLENCIQKKYEFKEEDFVRVWKGLFYAVWMSDKPLVQEELCESIASLLDVFPPHSDEVAARGAPRLFSGGLRVLAENWYGIDHHRLDKFLMLVRRYFRGALRWLARSGWTEPACAALADILSEGVLSVKCPAWARNATSLALHLLDIYVEEIAKVSKGAISPACVSRLYAPVCELSAGTGLAAQGARRALLALLRQSELGLRHQHAVMAWQKMGCPGDGPEDLELVETSDPESEAEEAKDDEGALDPRAGRVDVVVRSVCVPGAELAARLRAAAAHAPPPSARPALHLAKKFDQFAASKFPLRGPPPPRPEPRLERRRVAARRLVALDARLKRDSDELGVSGLRGSARRRAARRARASLLAAATSGGWAVEETGETKVKDTKNEVTTSNDQPKKNKLKKRKKKLSDREPKKRKRMDGDTKELDTPKESVNNTDSIKKNETSDVTIKDPTGINASLETFEKRKLKQNPKAALKKKENSKHLKLVYNLKKPSPSAAEKTNESDKKQKRPTLVVNKIKKFQSKADSSGPKRVKFALTMNRSQQPAEYWRSVRSSPALPYDGARRPSRAALKPTPPTPVNPFLKKKLRL